MFERKPKTSYFKVSGCNYFILSNGTDNFGIFDPKSDEGVYLCYLF